MSGIRPGTCADPGPGDAHCTENPMHAHSCYDAGEDTSWNDGQFSDGWYDENPHRCDDPTCEGRPAAASLSSQPLAARTVGEPLTWADLVAHCSRLHQEGGHAEPLDVTIDGVPATIVPTGMHAPGLYARARVVACGPRREHTPWSPPPWFLRSNDDLDTLRRFADTGLIHRAGGEQRG